MAKPIIKGAALEEQFVKQRGLKRAVKRTAATTHGAPTAQQRRSGMSEEWERESTRSFEGALGIIDKRIADGSFYQHDKWLAGRHPTDSKGKAAREHKRPLRADGTERPPRTVTTVQHGTFRHRPGSKADLAHKLLEEHPEWDKERGAAELVERFGLKANTAAHWFKLFSPNKE